MACLSAVHMYHSQACRPIKAFHRMRPMHRPCSNSPHHTACNNAMEGDINSTTPIHSSTEMLKIDTHVSIFFFRHICHIAAIVAVVRDDLLNAEDHRAGRLAALTIHSAAHAHAHGISDHHDMALSCTCRSPCPYRHAGCVHLTLGRPVVLAPPLPRSALTTMWLVKPHHSRRTEIADLSRLLKK